MMSERPPAGLEIKVAAALLEPTPDVRPVDAAATVDDETGEIVALVAVTGVVDDVSDVIEPGAFRRSLKIRTPRMCAGPMGQADRPTHPAHHGG
ncbi:MAG TPA: hypothetical protein VM367_01895 [Pseudonocardia sp.]|jgi:hypothetical protein|nr:hypothetical protein [Pseudonocardia sp.]